MDLLSDAYRSGEDALSVLEQIRGQRGWLRTQLEIDGCREQIGICRQAWAMAQQPQPDSEREAYEREVASYENAIMRLEQIPKDSLLEHCLNGDLIAIGYRWVNGPVLAPIWPEAWAFLELDFETSCAVSPDGEYRKIRFLSVGKEKKHAWSEIRRAFRPVEPQEQESSARPETREEQSAPDEAKAPLRARTTREDALTVAIKAARNRLQDSLKREPKAAEVVALLENDPSNIVCDCKPDGTLIWEDASGKLHDTKPKSIANRLSRIRASS